MTTDTNWVPCVIDIRYEISKSYPHQIRKIADQTLVSESTNNKGYIQCSIGGTTYLKHRVIALQFVENDDPGKFNVVDHKDHDRTNNRIDNLRWCSQSTNCKNKSSHMGKQYTFIDYGDEPEDLIPVDHYGNHKINDYYYSPVENKFYLDTGVNIRELPTLFNKKGLAYVWAVDERQHRVAICYNKFKRMYGFQ